MPRVVVRCAANHCKRSLPELHSPVLTSKRTGNRPLSLVKRNSVIGLCVGLLLVQACRREGESTLNLTLAYEVAPLPARVGPVTITLRVTDVSGKPVTGARVTFEGNMSHAGMVPVVADAREVEPGRYLSTMELSMAGDWNVAAHVTLPDGRRLDQQFEIKGVDKN